MSKKFKRRLVRERVLQILYGYSMNKESLEILINATLADIKDSADKEFAHDLVNRVLVHKDELEIIIKHRVDNWELNRIAIIDKILLQMAICELYYFPEIPPKVSINEVIEVAKQYSTAGSGKFINGILDAVLSELKDSGNLNKSGRGLMEETIVKPEA